MIGDGNLGLTEVTPGAAAWLAQTNANLQEIDDRNPWVRQGLTGENMDAGSLVAWDEATSLLQLADANGVNGRWRVAGMTLSAAPAGVPVRYQIMGEVEPAVATGGNPGEIIYLSDTPGQATSTDPGSARKVGIQTIGGKFLLYPFGTWTVA